MTSAFTRDQTGPTPTYRLLEAQARKLGRGVWWTVRYSHKRASWIACAHYKRFTLLVATRATMDEAMRGLLGKMFELDEVQS